jgi:hypothetical protein
MTGAEMSEEGRLFLEACGATGPLHFEWTDATTAEVRGQIIEQPALVVGRDPAADVVLDDPIVEPFHALLQVVDGRLFAVDLGSVNGLRWGMIPRAAGWVNRGQWLTIGRSTIRLVAGDREGEESIVKPAPTSERYVSRLNLPRVDLDRRVTAQGKHGRSKRTSLNQVLVLGGSSEQCKLRFEGHRVPNFACALIRTPNGLWMTNILPGAGASVNGTLCRFARLEDEDIVQFGPISVRVRYVDAPNTTSVQTPHPQASAGLGLAVQPGALREMVLPGGNSPSEIVPESLLEQARRDPAPASSPFGQALAQMVRLLGDVHRDHLALVRDELAEIRQLSRDMEDLRAKLQEPVPRSLALALADSADGAHHLAEFGPPDNFEEGPRPNPEAVREIVAERLEARERKNHSRWRKLLRLVIRS